LTHHEPFSVYVSKTFCLELNGDKKTSEPTSNVKIIEHSASKQVLTASVFFWGGEEVSWKASGDR
jgi:hypothetical protein